MNPSRRPSGALLLALFTIWLIPGCAPQEYADLALINGKVVTLDPERPVVEALAAWDGKIVAIGNTSTIERWVNDDTTVIDLRGRLAVPGLIEGHGHLESLGRALGNVRLDEARSWDAMVQAVARAAGEAAPGTWILGRGWHQEKWDPQPEPSVEGYPVHDRLSEAVPDHPVLLMHASGHAAIVNRRAMELAGIDRETPDPEGGKILRDRRGLPTGVLREAASGLVGRAHEAALASRTDDELRRDLRAALERGIDEALANGVTSFQDAGSSFATVDVLREMADEGNLGIRLWVMLREPNDALSARVADYRLIGYGGNRLTVRAIKRSIDGALGSHGAWLLEPYEDLPTSTGLNTEPLDALEETARIAIENDFQLCVHAIGDRGNRETLNVFEQWFDAFPEKRDLRWRVEHAQHLHPDDIPRFAASGVIASMQSVHCTSDGPWVPKRIGRARAEQGAYVWRKLIDSGATVINGTDVPVERIDPIANFHAAVTRQLADGSHFYPAQAMTREEALHSYTLGAAYAAFEEDLKGSLEPGKLADVTVFSRDILAVPADEIPETSIAYTIVGGKLMFARDTAGGE